MAAVGEVWRHDRFYLDRTTGEMLTKYMMVLAVRGGDIVVRLLTSRRNGRSVMPECSHADPYPGHYLGVLGGELAKDSWLDLRSLDDFDVAYFYNKQQAGQMEHVHTLNGPALCSALLCAANADDTTRRQRDAIFDSRYRLGCE